MGFDVFVDLDVVGFEVIFVYDQVFFEQLEVIRGLVGMLVVFFLVLVVVQDVFVGVYYFVVVSLVGVVFVYVFDLVFGQVVEVYIVVVYMVIVYGYQDFFVVELVVYVYEEVVDVISFGFDQGVMYGVDFVVVYVVSGGVDGVVY